MSEIIETMLGLEPEVKADLVSRVFFHTDGAELSDEARARLRGFLGDPNVDLTISDLLATVMAMHEGKAE